MNKHPNEILQRPVLALQILMIDVGSLGDGIQCQISEFEDFKKRMKNNEAKGDSDHLITWTDKYVRQLRCSV